MLNVVMLNVANNPFMLSVIMPSVVILNVVMLSVVAQARPASNKHSSLFGVEE